MSGYHNDGRRFEEIRGERPKRKRKIKHYVRQDAKLTAIHTSGKFIKRGPDKKKRVYTLGKEISDFYKKNDSTKR